VSFAVALVRVSRALPDQEDGSTAWGGRSFMSGRITGPGRSGHHEARVQGAQLAGRVRGQAGVDRAGLDHRAARGGEPAEPGAQGFGTGQPGPRIAVTDRA
jgi:hypothetical protein